MIFVDKFFDSKEDIKTLKKIALYEVATNPLIAEGYPKWQSQGFMQNKYSETSAIKYLVKKSLEITRSHFNNNSLEILSLWFVVNKKGQKYPWHFHPHKATAIIYLNKCKNKGTLFRFNDITFQLHNVKNNNALFFDGKINHAPPSDDTKNRITCAMDFN